MSFTQAPWQFDWKRPLWQQLQTPIAEDEDVVFVDHVAAAVLPSEVVALAEDSDNNASLFLTVTLSAASSKQNQKLLANVVTLEVMSQSKDENPEYKSLQTRTLRWPTVDEDFSSDDTTLDVHRSSASRAITCFPGGGSPSFCSPYRQQEEEEDEAAMEHDEQGACFLGIFTKNPLFKFLPLGRRKPRQRKRRIRNGLIAAALVRLPPGDQGSKDLSAAADEIKLVGHDAPITDLVLACLSSDHKIHFYSPWKLLEAVDHAKDNVLEEGMAAFVFGSALLSTVQNTILPLSQPAHTVRLSVPFLQQENAVQTVLLEQGEESLFKQQQQRAQPQGVFSLLDASTWDPTIDRATLPFQTKDNVPTHCVAALEYLCIAGRGRQRWKTEEQERVIGISSSTTYSTNKQDNNATASATMKPSDTLEVIESKDENSIASSAPDRNPKVDGGFVSFISLKTYKEKRTLFLPFAPSQISPFKWGTLTFLLVVGQGNAVAIRMDSSEITSVQSGDAPPDSVEAVMEDMTPHENKPESQKPVIPLHRFQIFPIVLPPNEALDHVLEGSDTSTSPPGIAVVSRDANGGVSIVQRTFQALALVPKHEVSRFAPYQHCAREQISVITTDLERGRFAQIAAPPMDDAMKLFSCHLGQGWSLVGAGSEVYFVCLEGASSERGAYVGKLTSDDARGRSFADSIVSRVLPVNPFVTPRSVTTIQQDLDLPFTDSFDGQPSTRDDNQAPSVFREGSEELDELIVEAIQSISSLNYRESVSRESPRSPRRNKSSAFTSREKSQRLLQHCSSWTELDDSAGPRFASQTPALTVQLRAKCNERYILSLRKEAVESGTATPFRKVLSLLSDRHDYFAAASLALDLLRDAETLRHLWNAFDKIDDESERSKLEGLLDGIVPIYSDNSDSANKDAIQHTLTQVADMTVGCLTKGGYAMSSTLEYFLGRNVNYDPSRAILMLVAAAASALSDDEDLVASVVGSDCKKSEVHSELILWPVRCLLKIGVARGCLTTALLLLNTTIPDELRRRQRCSVASISIPSMDMCKRLVSLIVAASPDAAEILLDCVDEKTRLRFWQSLEHETRLELSLLFVDDKRPLLRDPEVRSWTIWELQKCIESEDSPTSANVVAAIPSLWLKTLVSACLSNAGCNLNELFTAKEEAKIDHDEDGLRQYSQEIRTMRNALTAATESGGLDFDLLIPALLLLEHRAMLWHTESKTTTRSMLNAACYLAGRPSAEEPLFAMNGATLMQQCTRVGDVEAGANLIGGKNGLVLECCHFLIEELEMNMEEAEDFLLSDPAVVDNIPPSGEAFSIRPCHRRILWSLEERVLSIRTYGEFDTTHSRGKVDPVFAATVCLRTWWAITRQHLQEASGWLMRWLRQKLSITKTTPVSPNRLACAALVRALIWPSNAEGATTTLLAGKLQLDGSFLIQLTQACCGLVEALPDFVIEGNWKMIDAPARRDSSSLSAAKIGPADKNLSLDESFKSAISHQSWAV